MSIELKSLKEKNTKLQALGSNRKDEQMRITILLLVLIFIVFSCSYEAISVLMGKCCDIAQRLLLQFKPILTPIKTKEVDENKRRIK